MMAAEPVTTVFSNAVQGQRLVSSNLKFALELFKSQPNAAEQNIFMSPLSISVALAMTYLGARGNTMDQMRNVLHFNEVEDSQLHTSFAELNGALNKPGQPFKLLLANRLFGEKSYKFLDEFLAAGLKHYGTQLAPVDFRNDAAGAAGTVNKWVADQTANMVQEIVPAGAVDSLTRLILVNAIYFKGDWAKKFPVDATEDQDFHVSPTKTVKVKLMYMRKSKFFYGVNQELSCAAIELPYVGGDLSMIILLPDHTVTNLTSVEKSLTLEHLVNVEQQFHMFSADVRLWLPRFRLDEKLSLSETLGAMGMSDLFTEGVADLSGLDGTRELYVSKVLHRAVVEVNEEGTEAAAATAVVVQTRSAMIIKDPYEFRADHPFMFFIRHNPTKSILFLGRVVSPSSADSAKQEL